MYWFWGAASCVILLILGYTIPQTRRNTFRLHAKHCPWMEISTIWVFVFKENICQWIDGLGLLDGGFNPFEKY